MYRIKPLAFIILCIGNFLFAGRATSFAQSREQDSALSILSKMSPEQVETMFKMAINSLPPEKKSEIEESLTAMKSKTPEIKTVTLKNKTVAFVPLAHVSTPEFYSEVKNIVNKYKSQGYTVYYEQLQGSAHAKDTNAVDTLRLKLRKMIGIEPTRQTYAILKKFFPDVITQPEYKDLGITKSDLNADLRIGQLIAEYERRYGQIKLTPCDFEAGFDNLMYPCDKLNNDITPVIVDYRNEHVARLIKASSDKKILVLYGAKHINGMMQLIQAK
ncbi:hypothetical protein DBR32_02530 [Taibaiella sp. KBW10]|uniref:hypothetical protein n=1 Tax=Taibaiella sp. KBW10 TaxID=2153357 RepID=UPI000F5A92C6|nr:hypothetical protein [Taibaiella sp. KBW10]RQO32497.1 hypothetical protein DBR32_02530 [Taibaiella sp. KBW10]